MPHVVHGVESGTHSQPTFCAGGGAARAVQAHADNDAEDDEEEQKDGEGPNVRLPAVQLCLPDMVLPSMFLVTHSVYDPRAEAFSYVCSFLGLPS